jgi:CyaY protein
MFVTRDRYLVMVSTPTFHINLREGHNMSASPQYYECIDETFEVVESKLEELESDPDIAGAEGVLNVTFSNGVVFVLSRQPAVEQLWLATPGGGFHFVWRDADEEWFDTRTNHPFRELLSRELAEHAGEQIEW